MKGQVDIEFIVSFLLFLSVITFVTMNVVNNYPEFRKESIKNYFISKSYQISQLLVYDEGYPKNWNINNVLVLGLTDGVPYFLNYTKIQELNCNDTEYRKVKSILGVEKFDLIINITSDGTVLATCAPQSVSLVKPKYWVERFGVSNISGDMRVVKVSVVIY